MCPLVAWSLGHLPRFTGLVLVMVSLLSWLITRGGTHGSGERSSPKVNGNPMCIGTNGCWLPGRSPVTDWPVDRRAWTNPNQSNNEKTDNNNDRRILPWQWQLGLKNGNHLFWSHLDGSDLANDFAIHRSSHQTRRTERAPLLMWFWHQRSSLASIDFLTRKFDRLRLRGTKLITYDSLRMNDT